MHDDFDATRKSNRAVVQQYLDMTKGKARLQRHKLFTSDAEAGLWTTDTGEPIVMRGMESMKKHGIWSLECFPDWEWYNIRIFTTDDPNHLWVECDGHGKIRLPGYPEGSYENHFLHSFEMRDGLIFRNREFMNPVKQFQALGLQVPQIRREGIPA